MILIDTNIAIDLRDGLPAALDRAMHFPDKPFLSFVTRIELEGGVFRDPALSEARRDSLNSLLSRFDVLPLTEQDVLAYGRIVATGDFDRRRILDRLIAAQCLTRRASLITSNPRDFADIPGLALIPW